MLFNAENRRTALALTYQAPLHDDHEIDRSMKSLMRAISVDPSLDLPRVLLFRLIHKTPFMENLEKPDIAATLQRLLPRPTGPLPADSDQILEDLRAFIAAVDALPGSRGTATGEQWSKVKKLARNVALNFTDPRHIVQIAQNGALSGFDHRASGDHFRDVINAKAKLLRRAFGVNPLHIPEVSDSPYSLVDTVISELGRPISSATLWHAGFLMRILAHVDDSPLRVLEIGGGYGGLAMLFGKSGHCRQYVIVDLPESLVYCFAFLKLNFPSAEILLCANEHDVVRMGDASFVLIPAQLVDTLAGESFDVGLNTGSFQEMPDSAALGYMTLLQEKIDLKYFYSMNYYLEDKGDNLESRHMDDSDRNLVSPRLDAGWEVVHFEVNPPHIVNDSLRNWCEVLLRRANRRPGDHTGDHTDDHTGARTPPPRRAEAVISEIDDAEFGGQLWFQRIWMALWRSPNRRLVDRYLAGIKAFIDGATPVRETRMGAGRPVQPYETIGEVIYWTKRRDSLPE